MTAKAAAFLRRDNGATPRLVIDLDRVERAYGAFARAFAEARIFYAVKANPAPEIIARLARAGASFDAAGPDEIALCLAQDIAPERIACGSPVKKRADIAGAFRAGIRRFAFDARGELQKIADAAPGARVLCRIQADNTGAQWPLAHKFGCPRDEAVCLLSDAATLGLEPLGVSFHVGSQQHDPARWAQAIETSAGIFSAVEAATGQRPRVLNIGGGFPVRYLEPVASIERCARVVGDALDRAFANRRPEIMIEPGRALVGEAGIIETEIVLIAEPGERDGRRWIYLDVGRFNGLAETAGGAICYRASVPGRKGRAGRVVLAGPSCDASDMVSGNAGACLPSDIQVGDRLLLHCAGAYTHSTSSVGFNGHRPLALTCI